MGAYRLERDGRPRERIEVILYSKRGVYDRDAG
jgi:hypothetical protein